MQMDLIRQQLEFEAQHIRSLMEERFGTSDEMVQRAQVRGAGPRAGERIRGQGLLWVGPEEAQGRAGPRGRSPRAIGGLD